MSFYQNGILISGVNTLPELTRAQYEALPADKRPEYWVCLDEEYEPSSSGHVIENSAGTKLTQRDVMQVLDGLEAVDDSTNQKTKIKMNLPIVSSADWNAMTEQEKTAYKASHYRFGVEVPDTEGVINAEYMKLLWENPNTTQAFAEQTVTLSSADYDFLLFIYSVSVTTPERCSVIAPKGSNAWLDLASTLNSGTVTARRSATYNSATSISFGTAYIAQGASTHAENTSVDIPIAIYGIKKNFQFKVNAIATDLSTSADHCMLSDDATSVEEALGEKMSTPNYSNVIATITTAGSSYTCPKNGYLIGMIYGSSNGWASIRLKTQPNYFLSLNTDSTGNNPSAVCIPFKKDDVIVLGGQGTYNLAFTG